MAKRTERTAVMIKILTENPNVLFSLNYFTELFDAAKSTISEDITIIKQIMDKFDLGKIKTFSGATGGVKYIPNVSPKDIEKLQIELCERLQDKNRILTGGFLFTSDIMFGPAVAKRAGCIFATKFVDCEADYIVTIESKGIPLAAMTADALNLPLVVMRRESKISEGSTMSINYVSGSTDRIQKMSVAKRMLVPGKKAILIDDFMKGGGSARGMVEMMKELDIEVVGIGVLIATSEPVIKKVDNFIPLLILDKADEVSGKIYISPNNNI